jgi:hypothetical protein
MGAKRMSENDTPVQPPSNLLWALDEIIIALQHFREQLRRLAAEAKR